MRSATSLPASAPYAIEDQKLNLKLHLTTPAPSPLQLRPATPVERRRERPGERAERLRYCRGRRVRWGEMSLLTL
jgi:hypothetical protein